MFAITSNIHKYKRFSILNIREKIGIKSEKKTNALCFAPRCMCHSQKNAQDIFVSSI